VVLGDAVIGTYKVQKDASLAGATMAFGTAGGE
jgi:hypothetical protein